MKQLLIERNRYFDSVFLMRISSELEKTEGVTQAVVAMATPVNVDNLIKSGFNLPSGEEAVRPADLIIAIDAESSAAEQQAQSRLRDLLAGDTDDATPSTAQSATSLDTALSADPDANLALISVPGVHAAREARQALRRGLHVMLFSDNVSIQDEIALKDEAIKRGLLMMGPDCGTAIIRGAALGFANACRSGTIGIVGASGTGIQEISSLIHQWGGGISQAVGTGGRDLSADVEGRMTRFGIEVLGHDPGTDVIVVVSKTPSPAVAAHVMAAVESAGKPGVVHFIGGQAETLSDKLETTATLADAARAAIVKSGIPFDASADRVSARALSTTDKMDERLEPPVGRIVGFYCGGTLCQEAWNILDRAGIDIRSNVAGEPSKKVSPEQTVPGHVIWDLGDDAFTVGKPHPMIEPGLRDEHVAQAGADPSVAVILADCVIGYGAHADPATSLAVAAAQAHAAAQASGHTPVRVVASVTGTDRDPQNLHKQRTILEAAGIHVARSNAAAAQWVADWMKGSTS